MKEKVSERVGFGSVIEKIQCSGKTYFWDAILNCQVSIMLL